MSGRTDRGSGRASPTRPLAVRACRATGTTLAHAVLSLRVTGREHVPAHGPVLLAGNHAGLLDGPLVFFLSPRPAALLTKSEVFTPRLGPAFRALGCIPVHRGRADRPALQAGLQVLRDGGALGVFPEGSRGSGTFEQVADGLAWLALRSGAPVVPVAVSGTAVALPKGKVVPRLRTPVRVAFGPPVEIEVEGDPRARRTVGVAAEQLRLALVQHLRSSTLESA